ncbi:MAG TPA: acylphosphatase [bacterium]|jgi:acylphosphatase|nr:acylphosphatase [bacterium]
MSAGEGAGAHASESGTRVRRRVLLEGRVQGVGFRFYTVRQAQALGVGGFVRNLPDGRVEAEAEGTPSAVEAFLHRLRRGPAGSVVRRIDSVSLPPRGEEVFRIA